MCTFAVGAYLLLAVDAYRAIGLLRANVAPLHDLAACWVWKFACYLYVKFQEPLQGHVCRETLHSLVGDPVFCTAFWALYLSPDIVYQTVHAGLHAEGVLAWQQFRVSIAIQADSTRQQLFELLHADLGLVT
jgi:hypothetical protein